MAAGRRSILTLAAFAAPCLPLAAFGLPLTISLPHYYSETLGLSVGAVGYAFLLVRLVDIGFDPIFGQLLNQAIGTMFSASKDQHLRPFMLMNQVREQLSFLLSIDWVNLLGYCIGGDIATGNFNHGRIVH